MLVVVRWRYVGSFFMRDTPAQIVGAICLLGQSLPSGLSLASLEKAYFLVIFTLLDRCLDLWVREARVAKTFCG